MAASMMRRAMVWLGLSDDEDYDYEYGYGYDDPEPARMAPQRHIMDEPPEIRERPPASQAGTIRPMNREDAIQDPGARRPAAVVRPISIDKGARVHVVAPSRFGDAKEISDRFMGGQPVIINLQVADRELRRRMIDFCSGVAYALHGSMEKVAEQVFLLTPSNVEVSAEERQRLQERGLLRS